MDDKVTNKLILSLEKVMNIIATVHLFKVQLYIFLVLLNLYLFGNLLKIYGVCDMVSKFSEERVMAKDLTFYFLEEFVPHSDVAISVDDRFVNSGSLFFHVSSMRGEGDMVVRVESLNGSCLIDANVKERVLDYEMFRSDYESAEQYRAAVGERFDLLLRDAGFISYSHNGPVAGLFLSNDDLRDPGHNERERFRYAM